MAIRIGELAKRSGLASSALRYYEESGLLQPSGRSAAGYRVYEAGAVGRLSFIQRARALGLTLKEIRELLKGVSANGASDRTRLRHVVAHKLAETDRRLGELAGLKSELEALYVRMHREPGPECGHLGDCGCWLPTEEEVRLMSEAVEAVVQCDCCDCPEPCDECDCDCCSKES